MQAFDEIQDGLPGLRIIFRMIQRRLCSPVQPGQIHSTLWRSKPRQVRVVLFQLGFQVPVIL